MPISRLEAPRLAGKVVARDAADSAPKAREAEAGKVDRAASVEAESHVVDNAVNAGPRPSHHVRGNKTRQLFFERS